MGVAVAIASSGPYSHITAFLALPPFAFPVVFACIYARALEKGVLRSTCACVEDKLLGRRPHCRQLPGAFDCRFGWHGGGVSGARRAPRTHGCAEVFAGRTQFKRARKGALHAG